MAKETLVLTCQSKAQRHIHLKWLHIHLDWVHHACPGDCEGLLIPLNVSQTSRLRHLKGYLSSAIAWANRIITRMAEDLNNYTHANPSQIDYFACQKGWVFFCELFFSQNHKKKNRQTSKHTRNQNLNFPLIKCPNFFLNYSPVGLVESSC